VDEKGIEGGANGFMSPGGLVATSPEMTLLQMLSPNGKKYILLRNTLVL
jgi:hypothetical protein